MYENYCPVLSQDDVRLAGKIPDMQPIPEPSCMQGATHQHFRSSVLAPDSGHHPGTRVFVYDINHVADVFYHRWKEERGVRPI